jgi:hypothetical protein
MLLVTGGILALLGLILLIQNCYKNYKERQADAERKKAKETL